MANLANPEYLSHVTLMILGDDLDPSGVSTMLGLRPTKTWKRGDAHASDKLTFPSSHEWGGWKKGLPASQASRSLPSQLRFWLRTLRGRARAISKLTNAGHLCVLDCYIGTEATASLILPRDLQAGLAQLGLELRISISAG